jgi:hypothetical protein
MTRVGDVENLFNLFSSTGDWRSSAPLLIRRELDVSEFQNPHHMAATRAGPQKGPDIVNPTSTQAFDWRIQSESHVQTSGFEYAGSFNQHCKYTRARSSASKL